MAAHAAPCSSRPRPTGARRGNGHGGGEARRSVARALARLRLRTAGVPRNAACAAFPRREESGGPGATKRVVAPRARTATLAFSRARVSLENPSAQRRHPAHD